MRLFVTGVSGFVGAKLCEALAGTWHLTGTYRTGKDRVPRGIAALPLDIRDATAVEAALEQARPDAIVHTAAMADLGRCEREPGAAAACNVDGTRYVAAYARRARVPLVYLSTDLVFDGQRGAYAEGDVPSPACVYGATKYAGERAALAEHPDACILRLALTYGTSANSQHCFLERMLRALRKGEQVRLFVDEYRTPVLLDDLCATVDLALAASLAGVFHVAGPRRVSRYELGSEAAKAFGLPGDGIVPASRTSVSSARPADCSMRSSSALMALGCQHRDPAEGLLHMAASAPADRG